MNVTAEISGQSPWRAITAPAPTTQTRRSSAGIDQLAELVVADQPVLAHAERLDLGQQGRPVILGLLEAELLELDPDRVQAALLAEHDPPRRADQLRGVRLDRRRVVELAGHSPA